MASQRLCRSCSTSKSTGRCVCAADGAAGRKLLCVPFARPGESAKRWRASCHLILSGQVPLSPVYVDHNPMTSRSGWHCRSCGRSFRPLRYSRRRVGLLRLQNRKPLNARPKKKHEGDARQNLPNSHPFEIQWLWSPNREYFQRRHALQGDPKLNECPVCELGTFRVIKGDRESLD